MKISFDFDGVVCDRSGFPRPKDFSDCKPVKDALEAITQLLSEHEIYILTNRNKLDRQKIRHWLIDNGFPKLKVTNRKLPNTVAYIDDRAVRFTSWLDVSKYFI